MTDLQKKITAIVAGGLVLVLALLTIILPKKEYSENENRYLASFPKLSFESVKDASFMSDMETYVSDHFVLRDLFMTVKSGYERTTGRNQVNGIYMCEDGYYIEEYDGLENVDRIMAAMLRLCEGVKSADITLCLVPTAVSIYADKLPAAAKNEDQATDLAALRFLMLAGLSEAAGERVSFADVGAVLKEHADEGLYYRLDHHWTTLGAFYAYREICAELGIEPLERSAFEEKVVSTTFKGSFYSKVNDLTAKPDEITAFTSDRLDLTVLYKDKGLETDSLVAEEYLSKRDQYSYFLNNQNSFIEIHNAKASSDRVLAVVKDSYANCLVPFLCEHFETVYVFDTRYYREKVTEFINENGVTDVLFLYNMYTIDTDTGIAGIY